MSHQGNDYWNEKEYYACADSGKYNKQELDEMAQALLGRDCES